MSGIFSTKVTLARVLTVIGLLLVPYLSPDVAIGGDKSLRVARIKNESSASAVMPLVSIETVLIGDPGNAAASGNGVSVGGVASLYRIGKYEVTIAEYAAFLNAVATRGDGANAAVVESLYDSRMQSDSAISGISRNGSGTAAVPYAYFVLGDGKKPISYITWFNAARFANWMHNGASANSDIESGAYVLNGALNGSFERSPGALWWIPTQDEWFKAAYYKGGGTSAGYWLFPTQSDSLPQNNRSSESNQANFLRLGVFSVTQLGAQNAAQNYLTAVGTFINSPSAYGTFDQGGNVEEWTDSIVNTDFGQARITRGGAWNSGGLNSDVSNLPTALPSDRLSKVGFRLTRAALSNGAPATLSGVITVKILRNTDASRTLAPGERAQFVVRKGEFTVEARDAQVESVVASNTFETSRSDRVTLITVSVRGSQIVVSAAPENIFF